MLGRGRGVTDWTETGLRAGDRVRLTGVHADGRPYRWWAAIVREVTASRLVAWRPLGEPVHDRGRWRTLETIWQHVLWMDRLYILTEEYTAHGEPTRLDLDIASLACWGEGGITYRDHELDVFKAPGRPAEARDEDEFADAIVQYGYTPAFQAACWSALQEASQLADSWTWLGCPYFENTP